MANFRLRLVLLGLVLGVLIAIVFASRGCAGTNHHTHAPPAHRVTGR